MPLTIPSGPGFSPEDAETVWTGSATAVNQSEIPDFGPGVYFLRTSRDIVTTRTWFMVIIGAGVGVGYGWYGTAMMRRVQTNIIELIAGEFISSNFSIGGVQVDPTGTASSTLYKPINEIRRMKL